MSDELRRRVEEAIRKTGYRRNILARGLKTGESRTVGLTVGDINNPFYTGVVSVIQQALHRAGYAVMLCCSDRDAILQAEQIELLGNRMVDGLIISPFGDDDQLRRILRDTNIPVVLIDRILEGLECDSVVLDNRAAVMEATRYLLGLGHRRIGFISGTLETFTGRERLEGYYAALDEAGIAREETRVQLGDFREEGAYDAAIQLLTSSDPPTALFSSNNVMMIGAVRALRDLGLNCPEDVSVTGIDDFPWADLFRPHLTTVAQPLRAIGEQAANLLLKRLTGKTDEPPRHIVLKGSLVVEAPAAPWSEPTIPLPDRAANCRRGSAIRLKGARMGRCRPAAAIPQSGMLSCFRHGRSLSLWRSMARARAMRRRVEWGRITSSM